MSRDWKRRIKRQRRKAYLKRRHRKVKTVKKTVRRAPQSQPA